MKALVVNAVGGPFDFEDVDIPEPIGCAGASSKPVYSLITVLAKGLANIEASDLALFGVTCLQHRRAGSLSTKQAPARDK
jgi:hypothetical protein